MTRDNNRSNESTVRRRHLLYGSGVAFTGLAGCIGGDDQDQDLELQEADTTDVQMEDDEPADPNGRLDQAFVLPTTDNPEVGTFIGAGGRADVNAPLDTEVAEIYEYPYHVWSVMREPAHWGRTHHRAYLYSPGEVYHGILSDVEVAENSIRYTIEEDAYWSDGEPVTAVDGGAGHAIRRFQNIPEDGEFIPPREEAFHHNLMYDEIRFPDGPDGKVWEIANTTYDGLIGDFYDRGETSYVYTAGGDDVIIQLPTHIAPFDEIAEYALSEMERGLEEGVVEIIDQQEDLWLPHVDEATLEKFREPENVVTTGVWTLDEIRGAEEWVLKPNEYHRHHDDLNFSQVRMPWIEEDTRIDAELRQGRLDYAQHFTPEEFTAQLTDTYEQEFSPGADDLNILFNHNHPVFGEVKVRQAIAFAVDSELLATAFHEDLGRPIDVPGGAWLGREAWVSDEWVDDNLIDYAQDIDRAEALMQEAGLERGGDGSWLHEGEPVEFVLPTAADTPDWEIVLVDQLNEFGFNVTLQTMDSDLFDERRMNGEFDVWPEPSYWRTELIPFSYAYFRVFYDVSWLVEHVGMYHIPEEEEFLKEVDAIPMWQNPDEYEIYYEIPPIGEPDAEPESWEISTAISRDWYMMTGTPEQQQETLENVIWGFNWSLPMIQFVFPLNQHFLNKTNFDWPSDHPSWEYFGFGVSVEDYLSMGMITADLDNPK